jgi:hypothetical protein
VCDHPRRAQPPSSDVEGVFFPVLSLLIGNYFHDFELGRWVWVASIISVVAVVVALATSDEGWSWLTSRGSREPEERRRASEAHRVKSGRTATSYAGTARFIRRRARVLIYIAAAVAVGLVIADLGRRFLNEVGHGSVTLQPDFGPLGSRLVVRGDDWERFAVVTAEADWDHDGIGDTQVARGQADASGSFRIGGRIPSRRGEIGALQIVVSVDESGATAFEYRDFFITR